MASRWARLATSGTTPPKRACWSTLDATASASRVCPRTMPMPVSSHEVSMPRTSGSLMWLLPNHDQGVGVAGLVVAATDGQRLEARRGVQLLRRLVVDSHFQQHFAHPVALSFVKQVFQQNTAETTTLRIAPDGQILHPALVGPVLGAREG